MDRFTAISLFSCGGIGDLALRAAGFDILVSNEVSAERHAVYQANFPSTLSITGDIWLNTDEIVESTLKKLAGRRLDMIFATPPCQGMSKNGRGKLLSAIREGSKSEHDSRNRLIIPTIEVAKRLQPEVVLLENVPEMESTVIIEDDGRPISVLDLVERELGSDYAGLGEVIEFADYGVPQCRQRLISVFSKADSIKRWHDDFGTLMPTASHSAKGQDGKNKWVTLRDVISDLPALDASKSDLAKSSVPFHRVPLLDAEKYWWVSCTPPEKSAFDNQCSNCSFNDNETHSARRDHSGINRASRDTPIYCQRCNNLLPRPIVVEHGNPRLMRGYTSAYKRMSFDRPASALTRNLSYACSDNKLHPEQNRVLSLHEAFRVHTLDRFDYKWERADGRKVSDKTIRELLGESIPPAGLARILTHLTKIYTGRATAVDEPQPGGLFALTAAG